MKRSWTAPLAVTAGALALAVALPTGGQAAENWYPFPIEVWDPPFDMASPRKTIDYVPLAKASKSWDICVSFPHKSEIVLTTTWCRPRCSVRGNLDAIRRTLRDNCPCS